MNLIYEMITSLPIYAYPTKYLLKAVTKYGLTSKTRLEVTNVFDAGNEGGIMCGIRIGGKVLVASLTHLEFKDEHPLKHKINAYKKDRISMLKAETFVKSISVGRNEPCPCGSGKKYKKCCGGITHE